MICPPPIAEIITSLLAKGLLHIRGAGWAGDASCCAVEADHLHNLPVLLTNFTPDVLRFYWEVERPAYLDQCPGRKAPPFEDLWEKLASWIPPPTPKPPRGE